MTTALLAPDDSRWTALLERVDHDVYYLPGYLATAAAYEGGRPVAFYAEAHGHALLVPLLLRPLPAHLAAPSIWCDATSPYGYPGPLVTPGCPPALFQELLQQFEAVAARHHIVSLFLRLHPLLNPQPPPAWPTSCHIVAHGPMVYLDLQAEAAPFIRQNHRRDVRRLRRDGFTAVVDDWASFSAFRSLYKATMDRVQAQPFYYFSDGYFNDLRRRLNNHLHLCTIRAPGGEVAAAGLFTTVGHFVQYHLSGTHHAYLPYAPFKLAIAHMLRWAEARGYRTFHLGGGVSSKKDSLFRFKAGFSRERAAFRTVRWILDPNAYALLVGRQPTTAETSYFPAYRAPADPDLGR